MRNPEDLRTALLGKLMSSKLVDVTKISYNVAALDGAQQNFQIFLRCTRELTEHMASVVAPQFPSALVLNSIEIWKVIKELATGGEIDLMPSETLTVAGVGVNASSMPYYGIKFDAAQALVTTPVLSRVNFNRTHLKHRHKKKTHADRWAMALVAKASPHQLAPDTLALQLFHVPDTDTVTHKELEAAITLSVGWNYLQLLDSSFFAYEIPRLGEQLRTAQLLASAW